MKKLFTFNVSCFADMIKRRSMQLYDRLLNRIAAAEQHTHAHTYQKATCRRRNACSRDNCALLEIERHL